MFFNEIEPKCAIAASKIIGEVDPVSLSITHFMENLAKGAFMSWFAVNDHAIHIENNPPEWLHRSERKPNPPKIQVDRLRYLTVAARFLGFCRCNLDIAMVFQRLLSPMSNVPEQFVGVTAVAKANVYFNGSVVSHAILFPDGSKKTLGLIYPGKYHFNTETAERMMIVAGNCQVEIDGHGHPHAYSLGTSCDVPAKSGFTI